MTDEQALRAAVIRFPDEDVPRLAYADLMDERGEAARGELIRDQIEWRSGSQDVDLLKLHAGAWCGLPHDGHAYRSFNHGGAVVVRHKCGIRAYWRRGFVDAVDGMWHEFAAVADAFLAREPVTAVTLTTMPEVQTLAGNGSFTRYRLAGRGERFWRPGELEGVEGRYDLAVSDDVVKGLLRAGWPSVKAWHLPPVAEAIPTAGWRIELVDERIDTISESPGSHMAMLRSGRLTFDGQVAVTRESLGREFGPLTASDNAGGIWRVPLAILSDVTHYERQPRRVTLDARTVGAFGPAIHLAGPIRTL